MKTQNTYKGKLTKWLLRLSLLFSIFTFSGYAGNSQPRLQETTPIELVVSNNPKICKQTVSYKKGIELINFSPLNDSNKNWATSLCAYNLLTKVKLDTISKQFYSHKPANPFLQVKTITQSPDEDIFETFIG